MPSSSIRKLQWTGKSTYTVSLPKAWVQRAGLKKGDQIDITQLEDGSLQIRPLDIHDPKAEQRMIHIEEWDEKDVARRMISAYINGSHLIRISSKEPLVDKRRELVTSILTRMMGCEIVEDTENCVTIQDMISLKGQDLGRLIRQLHALTDGMLLTSLKGLMEGDEQAIRSTIAREDTVDRFYYLITRLLVASIKNPVILKDLQVELSDVIHVHSVVSKLERISDHARSLALQARKEGYMGLPPSMLDKIKKEMVAIQSSLNGSIKAFLRADITLAKKLIDMIEAMPDDRIFPSDDQLKGMSPQLIRLMFACELSLTKMRRYVADICLAAFDRSTARG